MKNIIFKLSVFLASIIIFPVYIKVYAQGPSTDEVAASMLKLNLFSTTTFETINNNEDSVVNAALAIRPSCVQVRSGNEVGSGNIFSIDNDNVKIITAKHVVKNYDEEKDHLVIFFSGVMKDFSLDYVSDTLDLAIISIKTNELLTEDLMNLRSVSIGKEYVKDPESDSEYGHNCAPYENLESNKSIVFAMESDSVADPRQNQKYNLHGNNTDIADGYVYGTVINPDILVNDFGYNMLYVKCSAHEGMSGGGVFDLYGNYIGLLAGGSDNKEMVAVRLPDIISFLDSIKP